MKVATVPIVLFGDGRDWHGRALKRAFARRGVKPIVTPLRPCGFSTEKPHGLFIPNLGDTPPAGAFVRFIPGGSFEEVTLWLGVLHALRELGCIVWNDASAIERCVDKSTTTFLLQRAGIPTPATFSTNDRESAEDWLRARLDAGQRVVQKPLFGAQGNGLRLLRSADDLAPGIDVAGAYYLQEFIPAADGQHCDWRIFVCGGRAVASMIRHGTHWITNIKQGARPEAAIASRDMAELALRAVAAVGADYAGVDIIQTPEGAPKVLEVNSMPAWNGLQAVSRVRIADVVVGDFLDAAFGASAAAQESRA